MKADSNDPTDRDLIAMLSLHARRSAGDKLIPIQMAKQCYEDADAMLAESEKKPT